MPDDAAMSADGTSDESKDTAKGNRFAVLDVFGLKLEVSNPRLAELLTMDAKEALGSDVRELVAVPAQPDTAPAAEPETQPQSVVPEIVLAAPTPHDEQDARLRREFRARADADGAAIGFQVRQGGIWHSEAGLVIVTRVIERGVSLAAASHYVGEIAARREQIAGADSTVLFVVDSQQTADVFKVAIRQSRLYDLMRTISIDNLEDIRDLVRQDAIDHKQAVVLLVPITNIDVGEVLSIIRSTSPED